MNVAVSPFARSAFPTGQEREERYDNIPLMSPKYQRASLRWVRSPTITQPSLETLCSLQHEVRQDRILTWAFARERTGCCGPLYGTSQKDSQRSASSAWFSPGSAEEQWAVGTVRNVVKASSLCLHIYLYKVSDPRLLHCTGKWQLEWQIWYIWRVDFTTRYF